MDNPKVGELVNFHHNNDEAGTKLPPNTESAPAIVVGTGQNGSLHLNVFTADMSGDGPVKLAINVPAKKGATGQYWDFVE